MKISLKTLKFLFNALLLASGFAFGLSFDNLFGIQPVEPTHKTGDIMLYIPFVGLAVSIFVVHTSIKKMSQK